MILSLLAQAPDPTPGATYTSSDVYLMLVDIRYALLFLIGVFLGALSFLPWGRWSR